MDEAIDVNKKQRKITHHKYAAQVKVLSYGAASWVFLAATAVLVLDIVIHNNERKKIRFWILFGIFVSVYVMLGCFFGYYLQKGVRKTFALPSDKNIHICNWCCPDRICGLQQMEAEEKKDLLSKNEKEEEQEKFVRTENAYGGLRLGKLVKKRCSTS